MTCRVGQLPGVVLRWLSLEREDERGRLRAWVARNEAIWRESSSIRSINPLVLSGVDGETLAVVGSGATSQILSAKCEAESRLPTVWPASMAWTCCGRRLARSSDVWRESL
jgi:hypothetical protein